MFTQKSFIIRLTVLLFSSMYLYACAQPKGMVKKVSAYYSEKLPGTVRTDENGNPRQVKPDTVIVVYIETTTKEIAWDTAWHNNRVYKIVPQFFETGTFEAGFEKVNKEKVLITAEPGHFLYQLYLQPLDNSQLSPKSIESNQILLKGKYKGRSFLKTTGEVIQLEPYPSV